MQASRENGAGVCERICTGCSLGDEAQTLMRCHSCGLPQLYVTCGWKSFCGSAYNSKGIKGKISFSFPS